MVQEVLKKFHGDRQKTANVLGVSRTTVWRKVRQANGDKKVAGMQRNSNMKQTGLQFCNKKAKTAVFVV